MLSLCFICVRRMERNVHIGHHLLGVLMHPPPHLSQTNFFRCLRVSPNLIRMLTRNKLGRKLPIYHIFTITANREFCPKRLADISFAPISGSNWSRIVISVSKCMFLGSENPLKVVLKRYLHSILVNFQYHNYLEFKAIVACLKSTKILFTPRHSSLTQSNHFILMPKDVL